MIGMEEKKLRIVKDEVALTKEDIDKLLSSADDSKLNKIADLVALRVNTVTTNDILKETNNEIKDLKNSIAELIDTVKKQSIDESNTSFKLARRDNPNAIGIKSIDSHITHIISCVHIARCYRLMTEKNDKFSSQKARQLLIDLDLLENPHFFSKNLSGSANITKKYHLDILSEIKNRMTNPDQFNLDTEKCEHWRTKCFIPNDNEIKQFIEELLSLIS